MLLMPFAPTTSSACPSAPSALERIVWLIVSPVASAAPMITVPSIRPATISALRPRLRCALRNPSRTKTRLRTATAAIAASATTRSAASTSASIPTGIPKSLLNQALLGGDGRRVRDHDLVGLAAGGRPVDDEFRQLVDLRLVEPARPRRLGRLLARPEGDHEHLPFVGEEDVATLVA